jgi:hypothetical protein
MQPAIPVEAPTAPTRQVSKIKIHNRIEKKRIKRMDEGTKETHTSTAAATSTGKSVGQSGEGDENREGGGEEGVHKTSDETLG